MFVVEKYTILEIIVLTNFMYYFKDWNSVILFAGIFLENKFRGCKLSLSKIEGAEL